MGSYWKLALAARCPRLGCREEALLWCGFHTCPWRDRWTPSGVECSSGAAGWGPTVGPSVVCGSRLSDLLLDEGYVVLSLSFSGHALLFLKYAARF